MPVTKAKSGPYAPSSSILDIVSRYRSRGLPLPVTPEVLARVGIPESLVPRTIQALQTLDLIDNAGSPTEIFEGLKLAPEVEYRERMAAWIKGAYAEIFLIADPSKDDATSVKDAFRGFQPHGQIERMVSLFQGLCAAAGIGPAKSTRAASPAIAITPRQRTTAKRFVAERFKDGPRHPPRGLDAQLPAPLAGLLAKLPAEGDSWSKTERDRFVATFNTVLDFCFPVEAKAKTKETDDEAA